MMSQPTFDRRGGERLKIHLRMQVRPVTSNPNGEFTQVQLRNISSTGVCFSSNEALSLIKKYDIEVYLSDDESVKSTARITWHQKIGEEMLYGLSLQQLGPELQRRILTFFEKYDPKSEESLLNDRRAKGRRALATSNLPYTLDHRKIERRNGNRLKERKAIRSRFFSEEIKNILHRRVVITGLGIISPIGKDKEQFLASLRKGKSGIHQLSRFDPKDFPCKLGGEIDNFKASDYFPLKRARLMDLATQIGVASALLAISDSGLKITDLDRRRIGVAMGTTMGGLAWVLDQYEVFQKKGIKDIHPYTIAAGSPNACSGEIAAEVNVKGPCVSFSQGCTSSAMAISYAYEQVKLGHAEVMLAGGCEAPFNFPIYAAFSRSGLMTETNGNLERVPKPFSKNRGGIVLAEGAAVLVIEDLEHAMARKAQIYAEVLGTSTTCDGFDMIQPQTDGIEAARAIALTLENSELNPSDIDVIFTHAPGSRDTDKVEMKALVQTFKNGLKDIYIANLKPMIGYPQGATTAMECVAACLAMQYQFIPPVINTDNPEIELNISNITRSAIINTALIDCFGFGGKNVCLALRRGTNGIRD